MSEKKEIGLYFPIPPAQLGDFITGLLAKPQKILGEQYGTLRIDLDGLVNFHHLIEQRITQQNSGVLVSFTSLIQYNDGTSVELNSIDNLQLYTEVGPKISIGVALSWLYLIKFPNSSVPEPQTIDVWMECETGAVDFKNRTSSEFSSLKVRNSVQRRYTGRVSFRISHTARTWGFDMENMLSSYVKNLFVPDDEPLRDFFRSNRPLFRWFFSIVGVLIASAAALQVGSRISKASYQKYLKLEELGDSQLLMKKIELISQDVQGQNIIWLQMGVFLTFWLALVLFFFGFLGFLEEAEREKPSFIVLNEASKKFSSSEIKKYEKGWIYLVFSSLATIFLGVTGNIISYFII